MVRVGANEAAELFVGEHFPDCLFAILGGSAGRNEMNTHSDLDIVILEDTEDGSYRKVYKAYGWIIECFVLTPSTFREMFDEGIKIAIPTLQRIITEGIVIRFQAGNNVIEEARRDLEDGPLPWSVYEVDRARYSITDFLEDLRGARQRWEKWFSANKIAFLLCEFILRVNNRWIGEGKHLYRAAAQFSPDMAVQLEEALEALYHKDDPAPLEDLCVQVLVPYGGLLLEGFED